MFPLSSIAQSGEEAPSYRDVVETSRSSLGSSYIPIDSWMYPAAIRLYELGYLPTAYLGMRPWTRQSLAHMLQLSSHAIVQEEDATEAADNYDRLSRELEPELKKKSGAPALPESIYTRVTGISGPVLNDSYHLGQTVINDYGRPYQSGFNDVTGYSVRAQSKRFSFYVRGEYEHAPKATGYSTNVADSLAQLDAMPDGKLAGIPEGPIPTVDDARILEANVSIHLIGHEVSFGKSDDWLGPAAGSSMAWSNNAENIYAFRINRVEPLYIPGLSRFTGLFRYDFFVGSLKGHIEPNDPWVHSEKISFKPNPDIEIGFQRSVLWGGKGHVPVTIHTFLRSFFSTTAVEPSVKFSRLDPGARFSEFDFLWRVPWQRHLLTIYTDSTAHDDVFPISNPRRAGLRPGIYLSRLPGLRKVDLRAEGASTDPRDPKSSKGEFLYFEAAYKQGYTNRKFILGDWIGRQGTGGQAWLTWHLRPEELIQLEYRTAKAASDFIPGGTTQQSIAAHVQLRPMPNIEIKMTGQAELWRAPLIAAGTQKDYLGSFQITYFPHWR